MIRFIIPLLLLLSLPGAWADNRAKLYTIEVSIPKGSPLIHVDLIFHRAPPSKKVVDAILKTAVKQAAAAYPHKEILGTAFDHNDDVLRDHQYSGRWIYDPKKKTFRLQR